MTPLPAETLTLLAQYDTPTICNVIELCEFQPRTSGYLSHAIRAIYPEMPPMVGYAATVKFCSSTAPAPQDASLGLSELLEAWQSIPAPRVIVIEDIDPVCDGAVCGEIMAAVFKAFGSAGLVTNGCVRDIQQVKHLEFPCFATGIAPSHAYGRLSLANQPIPIGRCVIRPGDLLHGDGNGVTTIPASLAARVAQSCSDYVAIEQILIKAAKADAPLSREKFRQSIEIFMKQHEQLSKQLSGQIADRRFGV